ncbi:hypothetical protein [Cohnella boryungensis]|uniref:Uncharacterized protein n=1 Tax=Cohnella boryungensis TaxID=768479 RepID=A0ABV8SC67_9BACL
MKLMTNEKQVLEQVLVEGQFGRKPTAAIRVLMKHYFSQGLSKEEVREKVEGHLAKQTGYQPARWDKTLTAMVRTIAIQSHELHEVESVDIMRRELDNIAALQDRNLEKLAFVLLVYAKAKNKMNPGNKGWVSQPAKLLLKEAELSRVRNKELLLHELVNRGYITPSRIVDREDVQVNLVLDIGEAGIVIRDLRDVVAYYLQWKEGGTRYAHCAECGLLFRRKSNNGKYCACCKKQKELAWKRENMRSRRRACVE